MYLGLKILLGVILLPIVLFSGYVIVHFLAFFFIDLLLILLLSIPFEIGIQIACWGLLAVLMVMVAVFFWVVINGSELKTNTFNFESDQQYPS